MYRIKSTLCKMSAIAVACLAAVSCLVDAGSYDVEMAGEARVTLNIKTPAPALPGTRASFGVDNDIVNVWVLVFKEAADGTYRYQYKAEGAIAQGSASAATFTAVLRQSDAPVKLMVTANVPEGFADGVTAGMPEDDVRLAMTCSFLDLTGIDAIPMAGDVVLPSLGAGQNSANVSLLRSMARVQVAVDPAVTNFEMTEMYVYRANTQIQIAATSGNIDTSGASPKVTAASVPSSTTPIFPLHKPGNPTDYVYTTESTPAPGTVELKNTATCIVVGGYYNEDTSKELFYRIDFDSGEAGHPLGQVLRNYTYQFTIKGVSVAGAGDADTAATELATTLNVNVVTWDDAATDVYIPATNDYFMTSGRSLELAYEDSSTGTITLTSTLPFTLTLDAMAAEGGPATISSDDIGSSATSIMGTYFNFSITRTSYDDTATPPVSKYTLSVMALSDNTTETNTQTVTVDVGGSTFPIEITQSGIPTYVAPVTMSVLTLDESTYGGLGVNGSGGVPGGGGMNMLRAMLDNTNHIGYFGPAGTVKIDQISYQELADSYFDDDNEAATFGVSIQNIDVIIMPGFSLGNGDPSTACCLKIIEWLKNPAHILIISIDASDSNTKIRTALNDYLPYTFASMGWTSDDNNTPLVNGLLDASPTGFSVSGNAYGTAPLVSKAGDEIFLGASAPFGAAEPSGAFKTADGIWEYSTGTLPMHVLPLVDVALDGTPSGGNRKYYHTSAMLMAVDIRYGIVWMGEPQMWGSSYGGMNTAGTDPLSILTANLWAWIIAQVNP